MGRRQPQLDLQQDWNLTYSREENNVTTLRFYRQRDTNDSANDTVIQVTKKVFVCHSIEGCLKILYRMIAFMWFKLFKSDTIHLDTF